MKYIIGNWKMNNTIEHSVDFIRKLADFLKEHTNQSMCNVWIAPPSIQIPVLDKITTSIMFVAQDISSQDFGAYTGELSAFMFNKYVNYVMVGHSERRKYFNETNDILYRKLLMCFKYHMRPIFCLGEKKEDRDSGDCLTVINQQLKETVMLLSDGEILNTIIAYEPVWAIGTGKTPSINEIEEVHSYLRSLLAGRVGESNAQKIPLLYGGSCSSKNSTFILNQKNVNGLLIGAASLDFIHFKKIIQSANELS